MKKIAILSVGDYRHITLISKYTSYFDHQGIPYDVICTDRYRDSSNREHVQQFPFSGANNHFRKVVDFLKFRNWACDIIKKNHYDFIIVWNENTALLFADFLLIHYRRRYIVNIRDVDFLSQKYLNIIREKVIRESAFSTYCSTSKLDFPKNYPYVLMRSMNEEVLKKVPKRSEFSTNKAIRIVYIGKVRFLDACEDIVKAFGNDTRFEIWFIGAGSEQLSALKDKYSNVYLIGAYEPEKTSEYLMDADVINSYFGRKVLGYERMSSIRFAYGPYMHVPVIVGTHTNMEEEGNSYGFTYGFGKVNLQSEADNFYNWYCSRNSKEFIDGCEAFCRDVANSDKHFYQKLEEVLEGK